jgi:2-methylcitrate dehydratase PrpD
MDTALVFAREFISQTYDSIPFEDREAAKKSILDTLGNALAGSLKPGVRELLATISEWGGKEQSSVIAYGIKVPAPFAGALNATMAHALDFDDTHEVAVTHPGVIVVPACLAMAEYVGKVSGKELVTATILGTDFMCRLGLAHRPGIPYQKVGWDPTSLYGYFAAAATACQMLHLNENQIVNALGIAYEQCAGNGQCVIEGAMTLRMGAGFAVKDGIISALLAERGVTGASNSLEGIHGLYNLYHQGKYDPNILTTNLGRRFEQTNITIKPYPCCRANHASIDAALALVKEHSLSPDRIRRVEIFVSEGTYHLLCAPLEKKRTPASIVDAQFSLFWTIATALVKGKPVINDFTETALKNKVILEFIKKINVETDPLLNSPDKPASGRVRIVTESGEIFENQIDHAWGSPEKPLSFDECVKKFMDCAQYSAKPLKPANILKVIEMVKNIEKVSNVVEIMDLIRA